MISGKYNIFSERRVIMEQMGLLYRGIKGHFGEQIKIEVVDPRNLIAYTVIIVREGIKSQISYKKILRTWFKGLHTKAVVVNGEIFTSGRIPELKELINYMKEKAAQLEGNT